MKLCPNCNSEVEDSFDLCWNCMYSFSEGKVAESVESLRACPVCGTESDLGLTVCPDCGYQFKASVSEITEGNGSGIQCLRCKVPLKFKGNYKFHEGTRTGVFGDLFELFENRESFDIYYCPECGKVEFFLPGSV